MEIARNTFSGQDLILSSNYINPETNVKFQFIINLESKGLA